MAVAVVAVFMTVRLCVVMTVSMTTTAATVCTGLRLEWCRFGFNRKAEAPDHIIQHMVMKVSAPTGLYLKRNMAVAEVVAGPGKQHSIMLRTVETVSSAAITSTITHRLQTAGFRAQATGPGAGITLPVGHQRA